MHLTFRAIGVAAMICGIAGPAPQVAAERADCTRYLVIRYDDYSPIPLYDRGDLSPAIERRLFALIQSHRARISVGVVPFADQPPGLSPAECEPKQSWLSNEQAEWVVLLRDYVQRGVVEPALHGFTHRRNTAPGHRPGEFRGQPLAWQQEAVRDGQRALERALQRPVQVFIPPWNAWDENTGSALADNGFQWLSPDLHQASAAPLPVRAVPQTTADPAAALGWIRSSTLATGSVLVLVTHPFDFEGQKSQEYWDGLESLLAEVQQSECWTVAAFGDLPAATTAEWNARFQDVVAGNSAQRLLEDSIGAALLLNLRSAPMAINSAHDSPAKRAAIVAALWIAFPALIGIGMGLLIWRLAAGHEMVLLSVALLTAIMLTWLITGAVNIIQQGYAIRGVRWQTIFLVGGCAAALIALLVNAPRRKSGKKAGGRTAAVRFPMQNLPSRVRYEH